MKRIWFVIGALSIGIAGIAAYSSYQVDKSPMVADKTIGNLISRPDILAALKEANRHDHSARNRIDLSWVAEYKNPKLKGQIAQLMSTALSRRLTSDVSLSNGGIEQIMVFDEAGCLVAADHATHDYDQSDEDKWKLTVGAGNVKPVREGRDRDPKGTTYQVSQAVVTTTGKIIGAVTLRWCDTPGGCR